MSGRRPAGPAELTAFCEQAVERARAHGAGVADACAEDRKSVV